MIFNRKCAFGFLLSVFLLWVFLWEKFIPIENHSYEFSQLWNSIESEFCFGNIFGSEIHMGKINITHSSLEPMHAGLFPKVRRILEFEILVGNFQNPHRINIYFWNDGLSKSPSNREFNKSMVISEIHHRFQENWNLFPILYFWKLDWIFYQVISKFVLKITV